MKKIELCKSCGCFAEPIVAPAEHSRWYVCLCCADCGLRTRAIKYGMADAEEKMNYVIDLWNKGDVMELQEGENV